MRETLRFAERIVSATVARVANHWYASITVETSDLPVLPAENQGTVGDRSGRQGVCHLVDRRNVRRSEGAAYLSDTPATTVACPVP